MLKLPTRVVALFIATAIALTALLIGATGALAETPDPTLGLVGLQTMLDASPSHSVSGYFKTVLQGSTISTIPCTILSIAGETSSTDSLILFKATGAAIDDIGGIAEGMSGSPIYVNDGGSDKIVGAVSYGDEFTIGGTGLATPIEAMLALQTNYAPNIVELSSPVFSDGRTINRVVVSSDPQSLAGAERTGALVAKPLATVAVGGLRPGSQTFKDLAASFAAKGITLRALASGAAGTSALDTPLVPGAAVAALASRGDMWLGSVGTVTLADTDTVIAFGHPDISIGDTSMFMTNAMIDGMWPNADVPYKLARPATLKGTVTQDRNAGILGVKGVYPAETTITVHATNVDTGKSISSATEFPRPLVSRGLLGYSAFEAGIYAGVAKLYDSDMSEGSADITTTITFGDGTHRYTATLPDLVDDGSSLADMIPYDAASVVYTLDRLIPSAVTTLVVESVNVDARITRTRRTVEVVGVDAPNGLRHGANRVVLSLLPHGSLTNQTVEGTLVIPARAGLDGVLYATGAGNSYTPLTVIGGNTPSQIASRLAQWIPNNDIVVSYMVNDEVDVADATITTPWEVTGEANAVPTTLRATLSPSTLSYGGSTRITGVITGADSSILSTAGIYATEAGQPERLLGVADLTYAGSYLRFSYNTPPLPASATIRVHIDSAPGYSDEDYGSTSANAYLHVSVYASVGLTSSARSGATGSTVTLTAHVKSPGNAGSMVVFEYFNAATKSWHSIASRTLAGGPTEATATAPLKLTKGARKVRVRFLGGPSNLAATSGVLTLTGN